MPEVRPVRIGNFSGFYGDRPGAASSLLAGPDPVDVLTGDYLAELTMLILWKARARDPSRGYATTFVDELAGVLEVCAARGVRIVTNAGGLNPHGLADRVRRMIADAGVDVGVAVVDGDDLSERVAGLVEAGEELRHLDDGRPLSAAPAPPVTANAYLGGWGIARALEAGAGVVVTGRVTDASLTVGPAAWWHGWGRQDWDALAGAVVAGHVIECGAQATGGNYPFLDELPDDRYPGFPIAEVSADGSSVITKQPGSGGAVTVGTVTAQLLYEIGSPAYANPDAVAHFDSIRLAQTGSDRVAVTGVRGSPPPDRLKVALNHPGGYRNSMTMVLTGLDPEAKAARAGALLAEVLGGWEQFQDHAVELIPTGRPDASTNAGATSLLRVTVEDPDPIKVGRRFSGAVVSLALAGYAGFHTTTPPQAESAFGVYWPALVHPEAVTQTVLLPDGVREVVAHTPGRPLEEPAPDDDRAAGDGADTVLVPLGTVCGARSGDKGGNANIGLWAREAGAYEWLAGWLTASRMRELLGEEAAGLEVRRWSLPDIRALNFVVVGLLGAGVAASMRYDAQAKGLGEYVRSRLVPVPARLLADGSGSPPSAVAGGGVDGQAVEGGGE